MVRKIISIFMIGLAGYYLFENKYRVMNVVLGNRFIRRLAVSSLMGVPGVRNKMLKTVFSGPSNLH